ncbi:MAG TPA: HutD family protein [Paraburkholderia sp.]|nr:HutD family protein [Paraburkholderia sp.]
MSAPTGAVTSAVTSAMQIALIPAASLVATPWKNGGGVTREIAAYPQGAALDAFGWRVSVADVAQPGPFSRFAGIDRTLVLLEGSGMLLDERGDSGDRGNASPRTHALTKPLDIARFAGETAIDARLVDGATRDFNLMVRRGAASGHVEIWRGAGTHSVTADTLLLFCATGPLRVTPGAAAPVALATSDTLRIDHAQALHCTCEGTGTVLAVRLELQPPARAAAAGIAQP